MRHRGAEWTLDGRSMTKHMGVGLAANDNKLGSSPLLTDACDTSHPQRDIDD